LDRKSLSRLYRRQSFQRLKDNTFKAYGGYICCCCGETDQAFLTLDHIANDGNEHRGRLRNGRRWLSGDAVYLDLRRRGYPPVVQVLCFNCNMGKHRNGGTCPHQQGVAGVLGLSVEKRTLPKPWDNVKAAAKASQASLWSE
jgi:hypothetical protein